MRGYDFTKVYNMLIYFDNCCFNRPFDNQPSEIIRLETQAILSIQQIILKKQIDLAWSFILDFENNANPHINRREAITEWKKIAAIHISALETIRKCANNLTVDFGIKSKDALHLACSIEANCHYLLTTDKQFLKHAKNIKSISVLNPIDFYKEWS